MATQYLSYGSTHEIQKCAYCRGELPCPDHPDGYYIAQKRPNSITVKIKADGEVMIGVDSFGHVTIFGQLGDWAEIVKDGEKQAYRIYVARKEKGHE